MGLARHKFVVSKLLRSALRARNNPEQNDFLDLFCATLQELGGVYVKFLQGVMLDRTIKSKNQKLLDIFENNVYADINPVAELHTQLGAAASDIELESSTPLAAGSYSAVYKGRIVSLNQTIAVKVQRPNIRKELRSDLNFLRVLARIYKLAEPKNVILDIAKVYGAFRKSCFEEIDFADEIKCMKYIGTLYKEHPVLTIPQVYEKYCSDGIITQEWIEGVPLTDALQAQIDGYSPERYIAEVTGGTDLRYVLTELGKELLWGAFVYEYIHGDPHPGNIRILPGNRLALIDFGLKGRPYPHNMVRAKVQTWENDLDIFNGIFKPDEILSAFLNQHQHALYKAIESVCISTKTGLQTVMARIAAQIKFEPLSHSKDQIKAWQEYGSGTQVLKQAIPNFKDMGLSASVHSLGSQRSHHTYAHVVVALGFKNEVWRTIIDHTVQRIKLERPDLLTADKKMVIDQALEYLYGWSEKVAQTNSQLALKIQSIFSRPVSEDKPKEVITN